MVSVYSRVFSQTGKTREQDTLKHKKHPGFSCCQHKYQYKYGLTALPLPVALPCVCEFAPLFSDDSLEPTGFRPHVAGVDLVVQGASAGGLSYVLVPIAVLLRRHAITGGRRARDLVPQRGGAESGTRASGAVRKSGFARRVPAEGRLRVLSGVVDRKEEKKAASISISCFNAQLVDLPWVATRF